MTPPLRIVLAYSGGLASSVAIPWLAERYGAEIVTMTLDLGRGRDLEEVRDRALASGAVRAHVLDARERLASDYVLPALKAGALADDPAVAALARPLVGATLVEVAAIEQAPAVAHGAADGAPAIAQAIAALNPSLRVLAPAREWGLTAEEQAAYARTRGRGEWLPQPSESEIGGARAPLGRTDEAALVDIAFERGVPTAINGVAMPLADLVGSLDILARPGTAVLREAQRALEAATLSAAARRFSGVVADEYRGLLQAGVWFSPLREALDAYVNRIQASVSGTVRLRLWNGSCTVVAAPAPNPLAIAEVDATG